MTCETNLGNTKGRRAGSSPPDLPPWGSTAEGRTRERPAVPGFHLLLAVSKPREHGPRNGGGRSPANETDGVGAGGDGEGDGHQRRGECAATGEFRAAAPLQGVKGPNGHVAHGNGCGAADRPRGTRLPAPTRTPARLAPGVWAGQRAVGKLKIKKTPFLWHGRRRPWVRDAGSARCAPTHPSSPRPSPGRPGDSVARSGA